MNLRRLEINRSRLWMVLACYGMVALLLSVSAGAQVPQPAQYLTELAMQIAEMHAEISAARSQISRMQQEIERLTAENKDLHSKLDIK